MCSKATELAKQYPNDLDADVLMDEVQSMRRLTSTIISDENISSLALLNAIHKKGLQTLFPQICVTLRIFTSIPVTVSDGERSFSKLALVKNNLRSTMGQERLSSLMVLACERDMAKALNYDKIITSFANKKARRALLC